MSDETNIVNIGLDVGTMNIVCARSDTDDIHSIRNVFLPIDDDISLSELSDISYVTDDDSNRYIIGDSAFTIANIFGKEIRRPMRKGMISAKEISSIDVLTLMVKSIIGNLTENLYCSYSVPSSSVEEDRSVLYHQEVFKRILSYLHIESEPFNEAAAIIFSEAEKEHFSGIAISFGAGMTNYAVVYKGLVVHTFSSIQGGDWIDTHVGASLNLVPNRITNVKERFLDLSKDFMSEKNKKRRRIIEALQFYYIALIDNAIKNLVQQIESFVDLEINEPIPIIISGGTSLPTGFDDLFRKRFSKFDFPLDIEETRRAKNPLTAVATGLLIKSISDNVN